MADAITTQVYDGAHNYVLTWNNISDGTGVTLSQIITAANLVPNPGTHLVLWRAQYDLGSTTNAGRIALYWKGAANKLITILSAFSELDYSRWGGLKNDATTPTGDVLLTTIGFAAGDTATLTLEFKKGGITGFNT